MPLPPTLPGVLLCRAGGVWQPFVQQNPSAEAELSHCTQEMVTILCPHSSTEWMELQESAFSSALMSMVVKQLWTVALRVQPERMGLKTTYITSTEETGSRDLQHNTPGSSIMLFLQMLWSSQWPPRCGNYFVPCPLCISQSTESFWVLLCTCCSRPHLQLSLFLPGRSALGPAFVCSRLTSVRSLIWCVHWFSVIPPCMLWLNQKKSALTFWETKNTPLFLVSFVTGKDLWNQSIPCRVVQGARSGFGFQFCWAVQKATALTPDSYCVTILCYCSVRLTRLRQDTQVNVLLADYLQENCFSCFCLGRFLALL